MKKSPNNNNSSSRQTTDPKHGQLRQVSLSIFVLFFVVVFAAWVAGTHSHTSFAASTSGKPAHTSHVPQTNAGPWGELEFTRITVEVPDQFITLNPPEPTRWFFKNYSKEKLEELFHASELKVSQIDSLKKVEWQVSADGIWITPPDDILFGMTPMVRRKIYSTLALFPENPDQNGTFYFRTNSLEERLARSGLQEQSIELFRSLLYPQGEYWLFADLDNMLTKLRDDHEKIRLIKTVTRHCTLLVNLKIRPDSNIEEMLAYWGRGGRSKDLRPFLESLARVPGGCSVDISHLLPTFVRQRIYTYPQPALDAQAALESCHWTSFNFFNQTPDARYSEPAGVESEIERDFYPIPVASQLGDLIFLKNSQGMAIHSAIYVADNIVFTKNGAGVNQPWIYERIEDMLPNYLTPGDDITVVAYRRKSLAVSNGSAVNLN